MKCPRYQMENREDARFCSACGQSLTSELLHPKCDHINHKDTNFCDESGQSLVEPTRNPVATDDSFAASTSVATSRYQVN